MNTADNQAYMPMGHLLETLVMHFGEMGNRWGINRTVGQIYALLVFSQAPLNAEQISGTLGFSRSNVSMGLKELQSWELVQLRHLPGDRKDYFTVPTDIWDIARTLILQRRRRELEPTLTVLRTALVEHREGDNFAVQRMQQMLDFMELLENWTDALQHLRRDDLDRLLKLGGGISKLLELTHRKGTHQ